MKIPRCQCWAITGLGLAVAVIVWYSAFRSTAPPPVGVELSTVEQSVDATGTVYCTIHVTNVFERRVVIQALLERQVKGEWQFIPCSQPGPMYISALWVLDVGEVRKIALPTPPDSGTNRYDPPRLPLAYRIRVDCWHRLTPVRAGIEEFREGLRRVRNPGIALLRRSSPSPNFEIRGAYMVIGGRGGTPIDLADRLCGYTEAWNDVQTDTPNPAQVLPFQFGEDWRGAGDP